MSAAISGNNSSHNVTIPTTIGALLTEEFTIDPLSHLPSFLELTFVDAANSSGRLALSAAWDLGISYLRKVIEHMREKERMIMTSQDILTARTSLGNSSKLKVIVDRMTAAVLRTRLLYCSFLRRMCIIIVQTAELLALEWQTLIMFGVDYYCMHYLAGSTGSEISHGLKRCKISTFNHTDIENVSLESLSRAKNLTSLPVSVNDKMNPKWKQKVMELTKWDKTKSALLAALIPYWKERCDQLYTHLKEVSTSYNNFRSRNGNLNSKVQMMKGIFLSMYPFLHMSHEGSTFLYQFLYLLGYTPYWSFSQHALGVVLRRMTILDVQETQLQKQKHILPQSQPLQRASLPQSMSRVQEDSAPTAYSRSNQLSSKIFKLMKGAFFFSVAYHLMSVWYGHVRHELRLRRRRWIAGDETMNFDYSTSQSRQTVNEERESVPKVTLPVPPPPMPPSTRADFGDNCSIDTWSCPLCHEPRINPTSSTSGYVFCYRCLILHLRQKGAYCPVTGLPCRESMIVRLFEPTASSTGIRKKDL